MRQDALPAPRLPRRPFWQAEPCPPWCMAEHTAADHPLDRTHFSDWEGRVNLTLSEEGEDREVRRGGEEVFIPPYMGVSLQQGYREATPRVVMGLAYTRKSFDLTAGEARALADQLVNAADLAEGHWGGSDA